MTDLNRDVVRHLEMVAAGLDDANLEDVRRGAHSLSSLLSTFGLSQAGAAFGRVEELLRAGKDEHAKPESAKAEPPKTEVAKPEPAKYAHAKDEHSKDEHAKDDHAKPEPAKADAGKDPHSAPDPATAAALSPAAGAFAPARENLPKGGSGVSEPER
jgi:hypothetical protein